jgi:hypothetical protein
MMTRQQRSLLLALGVALAIVGAFVRAQDEYDFAIEPAFLESLESGHTILPSFRIHIDARSDIKDVGQDCEVHLAGWPPLTLEGKMTTKGGTRLLRVVMRLPPIH